VALSEDYFDADGAKCLEMTLEWYRVNTAYVYEESNNILSMVNKRIPVRDCDICGMWKVNGRPGNMAGVEGDTMSWTGAN